MNDVRKMIYGTLIGFFLVLALWFSIIYLSSCGFTLTCLQAVHPVERTPIPTLIPASHSESQMEVVSAAEFNKCQISASDLVGAWVTAGSPETDVFTFVDVNGHSCTGAYAEDVQPLFVENGIWQVGSIGCISCHNAELTDRSGGLDVSSYDAIAKSEILGSSWENSKLREYLGMSLTSDGHSADVSAGNPLLYVGAIVPEEEATPTP